MEWIISLIAGAIGGNVAGKVLKNYSMGTLWNSVVGILGGGLGSYLLGLVGLDIGAGEMDLMGIVGTLVEGGVGGGVLMVIIGVIKKAMSKS